MEPKHSIYISSNYLVNLIRRIKKEIFVKRKYLNTKQSFLWTILKLEAFGCFMLER